MRILLDDYDVIVGEVAAGHRLLEAISVLKARIYFLGDSLLYLELLGQIFY